VGIRLQASEAQSAREAASNGAIVARVVPGSPAEKAGVKQGDQIVRAGTRVVRNAFDWEARLLDLRVGETMPISVKRGAGSVALSLTVADAPEVGAARVTVAKEVEVITLTEAIRQERGISAGAGALVTKVSDRVADVIGIQAGDVIVQVGNTRVNTAEVASKTMTDYGARGPVYIIFERGRRLLQSPSFSLR
jgi:serine protease Do